jgi:hypothetical protein
MVMVLIDYRSTEVSIDHFDISDPNDHAKMSKNLKDFARQKTCMRGLLRLCFCLLKYHRVRSNRMESVRA